VLGGISGSTRATCTTADGGAAPAQRASRPISVRAPSTTSTNRPSRSSIAGASF
jgi:hypothetical protein